MRRWVSSAAVRAFAAVLAVLGVLVVAACSSSSSKSAAPPSASARPSASAGARLGNLPITHPTLWICRPGMANDPCTASLATTVVSANGSKALQDSLTAPQAPPVDCFYVYPTSSTRPEAYQPLATDPGVVDTTVAQTSRFSQVCRIFAPVYRSATLARLLRGGAKDPQADARANDDIASAWHDYLLHYNNGRPVVLMGHSQGTFRLTTLIQKEVDNNPAERSRLLSAILLGGTVWVPNGKDVGGSFQHIPACREPTDRGCVVAYNSFGETPPAAAIFGRLTGAARVLLPSPPPGGAHVLCTNPADLSGGKAAADAYFPTAALARSAFGIQGSSTGPGTTTNWISYPGLFSAQCELKDGSSYLLITRNAPASDPRPTLRPLPNAFWGLHVYDFNVMLGNLVQLVRSQSGQ